MPEISTIYQPHRPASSSSAATTPNPTSTQTSFSTASSTTSTSSSTSSSSNPSPDTTSRHCGNGSPRGRHPRQRSHDAAAAAAHEQTRAFQIRQGSFIKLNALRLPSTVARFVIMQVIFSIGCAVLGILAVAFRCWMAYLCIPVVVGALELFIGILGYTAIKRPRKKALVKCYFTGCLLGSFFGLGLVVFSIIAAASENEYECYLLPEVVANCTVVRGARFAIELTTIVIGISEIVITQVMFMIMCYGSCTRNQTEDQRTRSRSRAPRPHLSQDIPANLELPSYDDHHNYPTSPFTEGSFFISSVSSGRFEPPSYTNIGLVNDEHLGGITPLAAALGSAVIPTEPPPPYSLFAPGMRSTPLVARNNPARGIVGNSQSRDTVILGTSSGSGGTAVSNLGIIQTLAEPAQQGVTTRGNDIRGSGRSVLSFVPPQMTFDPSVAWRDQAIHQSLRYSLEQSSGVIRSSGVGLGHQHQGSASGEEDPTILPPELYRDEIRRSGHRYSLSDPTLQGQNARNRPRPRPRETMIGGRSSFERTTNAADVNSCDQEVEASVHRSTECGHGQSPVEQGGDSPRRRPVLPPPYEGQHNIVRTPSRASHRVGSENRHLGTHQSSNVENQIPQNTAEESAPSQSGSGPQTREVIHQSRTLPSNWRAAAPEEAIYETIPSPAGSPARQETNSSGQLPVEREHDRSRTEGSEPVAQILWQHSDIDLTNRNSVVMAIRERWGLNQTDSNSSQSRSGSRSWDENAGQCERLPDVVGDRQTEQSTASEPRVETENSSSPSRQPPTYKGRRIPSHSPPPYRRNQSLHGHPRRSNLASPPPPYQGHQNADNSEPSRPRPNPRRTQNCSSRSPGHAVRETSELSGRVEQPVSCHQSEHSNTMATGNVDSRVQSSFSRAGGQRRVVERSHSVPRPVVSHSLPRVSVSAISPPIPSPRRVSSMSSSRNTSSLLGVTVTPARQTVAHSSPSDVGTAVLSSSSDAMSGRAEEEQSGMSSSENLPSYPSDSQTSEPRCPRRQTGTERARPKAPTRSSAFQPIERPQPLHPRSSSHPPIRASSSSVANTRTTRATVPLHPRSLSENQPECQRIGEPHPMPRTGVISPHGRVDGKPAAEIHPFRTVRSTPVKPQRVFVATKALANALQKGHLNDLLDEYEETII